MLCRKLKRVLLSNTNYIIRSFQSKVETLKDRGLLLVNGNDTTNFLQGLITNDIRLLDTKPCIYTMFLNQKGRVNYDAFIYKDGKNYLIECDSQVLDSLKKHIKMYLIRKKIDVIDDNRVVRVIFGLSEELNLNGLLTNDPRLPELGHRYISSDSLDVLSVDGLYKEIRYKLGVAEGADELPIGECLPLEMNLDYLNGVSFSKGCYIGQELTSRTKHTGVIRKRLMPIEFSDAPTKAFEVVDINGKEKRIGKLRGAYNSLGLGVIRLSELSSPIFEKLGVKVKWPSWWPKE